MQVIAFNLAIYWKKFTGPAAINSVKQKKNKKKLPDISWQQPVVVHAFRPKVRLYEIDKNLRLAAQWGIYLEYVQYGTLGATLCGLAFVIPSCIMVVLIGMAYKMLGRLLDRRLRYNLFPDKTILSGNYVERSIFLNQPDRKFNGFRWKALLIITNHKFDSTFDRRFNVKLY